MDGRKPDMAQLVVEETTQSQQEDPSFINSGNLGAAEMKYSHAFSNILIVYMFSDNGQEMVID